MGWDMSMGEDDEGTNRSDIDLGLGAPVQVVSA